MNIWQEKLKAFVRTIDKEDTTVQVIAVEPVEVEEVHVKTYRVVKVFDGAEKFVGFGLTIRDAEIFVGSMPKKMQRIENPIEGGDTFEAVAYRIEEE